LQPASSEAQFRSLIAGSQVFVTYETVFQNTQCPQVPMKLFLQCIARVDESPRFVSIVRGMTERKRAERLRMEFISTVSHATGLRTSLTAIYRKTCRQSTALQHAAVRWASAGGASACSQSHPCC
jgi:hypothetical protein